MAGITTWEGSMAISRQREESAAQGFGERTRCLVRFKGLHPEMGASIPWPRPMSEEAAGMDLCAAIDESIALAPGERVIVPCGFAMALPSGFEAQVRPRSGLALKHGITVLNSPGTIDSDYRGEVRVILMNHGKEAFSIRRGE